MVNRRNKPPCLALFAVVLRVHRHGAPHLAFMLYDHTSGYADVFQIEARPYRAMFEYYGRELITGDLPEAYCFLAVIPCARHAAFEQLFGTVSVGVMSTRMPCPCVAWNMNVVAKLYQQRYIDGNQKAEYERWMQGILQAHARQELAPKREEGYVKREEGYPKREEDTFIKQEEEEVRFPAEHRTPRSRRYM